MSTYIDNSDLNGIIALMRTHIEIRNRSWMKRVYRDCFLGHDAVDFLVTQGFADNRTQAIELGNRMMKYNLIKYVSSKDDLESSCLAPTNAGNGNGIYLGLGGCKFSFSPHTVHNSYVLDIALAEEIERAVAGASIESRSRAFAKLRGRVREEAESDLDWLLIQTTEVNKAIVNVYQRKRPRGDFKNVKMTGVVAESAKSFINSIMSFNKRKQWERMFEDGVVVEAIDIGEKSCPILEDDEDSKTKVSANLKISDNTALSLPANLQAPKVARKTDDVIAFLQTVDLAGIPQGMPIAFLNDPERQHALSHLRKQMMASNPQECMICQSNFFSPADIRFCPCCAMVSCGGCVSKRVYEVISRQVVSVCIHCYRSSSRIRHPPQAVQDTSAINESLRGKWWRPEELGMIDYSQTPIDVSKPIIPNLILDDNCSTVISSSNELLSNSLDSKDFDEEGDVEDVDDANNPGDGIGLGVNEEDYVKSTEANYQQQSTPSNKTARCKSCGQIISRDIEMIEEHMLECSGTATPTLISPSNNNRQKSVMSRPLSLIFDGNSLTSPISNMRIHGLIKRPELDKHGTRIIYRTARSQSKVYAPREVCALQDAFIDVDGTCYVYEVSVRHCDVRGMPGYVTADIMLLLHVAKPFPNNPNMCSITIISQIDTRVQGPQWLLSFITEESSGLGNDIGMLRKEDLIRELKTCGNLEDILNNDDSDSKNNDVVNLTDFDLLAVLGRGGFGKVMLVRYRLSNTVYAMKILKKTELRRRRQVERTHTERTILAAVRHPFIVCLHYAFQSSTKLYMVMDFVQGGDFFTLMRKFKRLPEDWVKLYVAEIAMALQHLHDMDIVYRDLKPENILLDGDGHVKLTDFGLSRYFETRPPATEDIIGEENDVVTRSFCGTEQYMSPEMLLQQGHNYRMDWWCLGLLMHEMISSKHPFQGPSHYDTLRNMVTKPPNIDSRISTTANIIIKNFLIKNPKTRLCCKDGISELKNLLFFQSIDWNKLYNKSSDIVMPYKPNLKDLTDISSFETMFTKEEPVDSIIDNDVQSSNKKSKRGILGLLGIGSSNNKQNDESDVDMFKGFSFTKDGVAEKSNELLDP